MEHFLHFNHMSYFHKKKPEANRVRFYVQFNVTCQFLIAELLCIRQFFRNNLSTFSYMIWLP